MEGAGLAEAPRTPARGLAFLPPARRHAPQPGVVDPGGPVAAPRGLARSGCHLRLAARRALGPAAIERTGHAAGLSAGWQRGDPADGWWRILPEPVARRALAGPADRGTRLGANRRPLRVSGRALAVRHRS